MLRCGLLAFLQRRSGLHHHGGGRRVDLLDAAQTFEADGDFVAGGVCPARKPGHAALRDDGNARRVAEPQCRGNLLRAPWADQCAVAAALPVSLMSEVERAPMASASEHGGVAQRRAQFVEKAHSDFVAPPSMRIIWPVT